MCRVMGKTEAFSIHTTITRPSIQRCTTNELFWGVVGHLHQNTQPHDSSLSVGVSVISSPSAPGRSTPKRCQAWHNIIRKQYVNSHLLCLHFTVINLEHFCFIYLKYRPNDISPLNAFHMHFLNELSPTYSTVITPNAVNSACGYNTSQLTLRLPP